LWLRARFPVITFFGERLDGLFDDLRHFIFRFVPVFSGLRFGGGSSEQQGSEQGEAEERRRP
jgi:hypothetical protein